MSTNEKRFVVGYPGTVYGRKGEPSYGCVRPLSKKDAIEAFSRLVAKDSRQIYELLPRPDLIPEGLPKHEEVVTVKKWLATPPGERTPKVICVGQKVELCLGTQALIFRPSLDKLNLVCTTSSLGGSVGYTYSSIGESWYHTLIDSEVSRLFAQFPNDVILLKPDGTPYTRKQTPPTDTTSNETKMRIREECRKEIRQALSSRKIASALPSCLGALRLARSVGAVSEMEYSQAYRALLWKTLPCKEVWWEAPNVGEQ